MQLFGNFRFLTGFQFETMVFPPDFRAVKKDYAPIAKFP